MAAVVEAGGQTVCQVGLREYEFPYHSASWFWRAMDGYSSEAAEIMNVLLCAWPDFEELRGYGNVVVIDHVWVRPRQSIPGLWVPLMEKLIQKIEGDCSILLAKSFPLEYGGLGDAYPSVDGRLVRGV
jgi:hypothetical protein